MAFPFNGRDLHMVMEVQWVVRLGLAFKLYFAELSFVFRTASEGVFHRRDPHLGC